MNAVQHHNERGSLPASFSANLTLQLRGSTVEHTPYSRLNQALYQAFDQSVDVDLLRFEDSAAVIRAASDHPVSSFITLANAAFPRVLRPLAGKYIFVVPYGTIELSDDLLCAVASACDDVWFLCRHAYENAVGRGLDPERAFLLPIGIDTGIFSPEGASSHELIPNRFTFLYIGALTHSSRIEIFFDAFEQEFSLDEPVVCAIHEWSHMAHASDALEQQVIQERMVGMQTEQNPRFYFLKNRIDANLTAKLYRSADALVHPQRNDDGAMQLLEAAACGLPILKSLPIDETLGRYHQYQIIDSRSHERASDEVRTLRSVMRYAYTHRDDVARQAQAISALVRQECALALTTDAALKRIRVISQREDRLFRDSHAKKHGVPSDFEAQAYSQNGEDGMLHEVFRRLGIRNGSFVEFGVETGRECNTALFSRVYGWHGLLMEGSPEDARELAKNYADFPNVRTVCRMLNRENIVGIFQENNVSVDLDLLVIDIDGNDFHIWKALSDYQAKVVVIEINPAYPPPKDWVMHYNAAHAWQGDTYYGASLQSMTRLGNVLGYALIALDGTSTNAVYVRRDLLEHVGFAECAPSELFKAPPNVRARTDRPAHQDSAVLGLLC